VAALASSLFVLVLYTTPQLVVYEGDRWPLATLVHLRNEVTPSWFRKAAVALVFALGSGIVVLVARPRAKAGSVARSDGPDDS